MEWVEFGVLDQSSFLSTYSGRDGVNQWHSRVHHWGTRIGYNGLCPWIICWTCTSSMVSSCSVEQKGYGKGQVISPIRVCVLRVHQGKWGTTGYFLVRLLFHVLEKSGCWWVQQSEQCRYYGAVLTKSPKHTQVQTQPLTCRKQSHLSASRSCSHP